MLIQTILNQNYFSFQNKIYRPEKGVSMGSPISNTVTEIFLQNLEQSYLKQLLDTNNIIFYTRYVDDILIIYNSTQITPEIINDQINKIHPNLHFTPTQEQNNTINFLDLLLIRQPTAIDIDIFRKPTTTDTINFTSNHPTEHKMAVYHHLIHRMLTLPLTTKRRKMECQKILTIASNNNNSPLQLIMKLKTQMKHKAQTNTTKDKNKKWASFTYHSSKIRKITNLFKHTNIKIAFQSTNTIQHLTEPRKQDITQEHNKSGIYKLSCKTCNKAFIGQTSRDLTKRHREHIRFIKNNDPQSAYAVHILNNIHEYGTITDTMSLLKPIQKTSLLIP